MNNDIYKKCPKEAKIYGLYDDGYLIFKGTRHQICQYTGISPNGFYEFVRRGMRIKKKYTAVLINGDEPIQEKPVERPKSEEEFEYLYSMLKMNGNTCSSFDPKPYLKKLRKKGIRVDVRDSVFGGYYLEVSG